MKGLVQARLQRGRWTLSVEASFADAGDGVGGRDDAVVAGPWGRCAACTARARLCRGRDHLRRGPLPGGLRSGGRRREPGRGRRQRVLGLVAGGPGRPRLAMRQAEGDRLAAGPRSGLDAIESAAGRIEALSAAGKAARRDTLLGEAARAAAELGLEDARLYQEVVRARSATT